MTESWRAALSDVNIGLFVEFLVGALLVITRKTLIICNIPQSFQTNAIPVQTCFVWLVLGWFSLTLIKIYNTPQYFPLFF